MKADTNTSDNISDFKKKKDFASSPDCALTEAELQWIFAQRKNNGFDDAFVKFSKRGFLVHVPSFVQILNSKRGM